MQNINERCVSIVTTNHFALATYPQRHAVNKGHNLIGALVVLHESFTELVGVAVMPYT